MKKSKQKFGYLEKAAHGVILSGLVMTVITFGSSESSALNLVLQSTIPSYRVSGGTNRSAYEYEIEPVTDYSFGEISLKDNNASYIAADESIDVFLTEPVIKDEEAGKEDAFGNVAAKTPYNSAHPYDMVGLSNVIYQSEETDVTSYEASYFNMADMDKLSDYSYLKSNFYTVDSQTVMMPELFDAGRFLSTDLKIDKTAEGPQVLIFHTHSHELYSNSEGINEGIVGVGEMLAKVLSEKYGINVLHDTGVYDVLDGKVVLETAYEKMEDSITKILKDNPSIQVAIDLHRDGVREDMKLVRNVDGKATAQIMFFNGLSTLNRNGKASPIASLPNPYLDSNLAMSFNMQLAANNLYPGLARKIYLKAYRYSLNMLPKSLLIEVGAQTNTKEEAFNAVEPIAKILASVVL